jgi:hypothetical protein
MKHQSDIPFADRLVSRDHVASYTRDVLHAHVGTVLTLVREDPDENPGWTWCKTEGHGKGWVHNSFIERRDETHGVLIEEYNAIELTVRVGDPVTVLDQRGGWSWVRTESGRVGWVPDESLRVPPSQCRPY